MILSVSSSSVGIKRSAMVIIMASSWDGRPSFARGRNRRSMPSVMATGFVVRVSSEEPKMSITRRIAIKTAR